MKAIVLISSTVLALYATEVGVYDWHQKHIGQVTSYSFNKEIAYVGTPDGFVGSLKNNAIGKH